jgi:hypothetical protein
MKISVPIQFRVTVRSLARMIEALDTAEQDRRSNGSHNDCNKNPYDLFLLH